MGQFERVWIPGKRPDIPFEPFEIRAPPSRGELQLRVPHNASASADLRRAHQVSIDPRMRVERRIETCQVPEDGSLPCRGLRVECPIPVGQRGGRGLRRRIGRGKRAERRIPVRWGRAACREGALMVVVAEVHPEQNVDERGAQLSHRDVRFAAQVDGLEGLEEPPAGA